MKKNAIRTECTVPDTPVWFFETSALVDIVFKKGYHSLYENLTKNGVRVSNAYVLMELKRGVIQYLSYFHNLLVNSKTWADAMRAITSLARANRQLHRMSTILEALDNFWQQIHSLSTGNIPVGEFLQKKATEHIMNIIFLLWSSYKNYTDERDNPMNCFIDIAAPCLKDNLIENKPHQCTSSKVKCTLQQLFIEKKQQFESVLNRLKQSSSPDGPTKKCIEYLHENIRKCKYGSYNLSNNDKRQAQSCWKCGDAILGVSAPERVTILTSNTKHFALIAGVLGKNIQPSPS